VVRYKILLRSMSYSFLSLCGWPFHFLNSTLCGPFMQHSRTGKTVGSVFNFSEVQFVIFSFFVWLGLLYFFKHWG
jgi:hypothetical protein